MWIDFQGAKSSVEGDKNTDERVSIATSVSPQKEKNVEENQGPHEMCAHG